MDCKWKNTTRFSLSTKKCLGSKAKSVFIESLILGIPIPSVLFAFDKNNNKYIVIDGKQRINTINKFVNHNNFRLGNLNILADLNGLNYAEILEHIKPEIQQYKNQFEDSIIKGTSIKGLINIRKKFA